MYFDHKIVDFLLHLRANHHFWWSESVSLFSTNDYTVCHGLMKQDDYF